jgi:hypothetical protein
MSAWRVALDELDEPIPALRFEEDVGILPEDGGEQVAGERVPDDRRPAQERPVAGVEPVDT